ncbi:MAG: hypothetical protein K6T68_13080 [Alicyclobacillus shizuokensis]|nr:hypothetical protein [Alicyclobacillus shizuokensis]
MEKVLASQAITVPDVRRLTSHLIKENFVFYMVEEMSLRPNTINGRVRSVRALIKFLHREGYITRDFGSDIPLIKGRR